jgi:viroplasmin and RNaseH domain-containing protein
MSDYFRFMRSFNKEHGYNSFYGSNRTDFLNAWERHKINRKVPTTSKFEDTPIKEEPKQPTEKILKGKELQKMREEALQFTKQRGAADRRKAKSFATSLHKQTKAEKAAFAEYQKKQEEARKNLPSDFYDFKITEPKLQPRKKLNILL